MTEDQQRYGNGFERTVIGHEPIDPDVFARELARYRWAAERIKPGMSVLEFGCSSGFATRLLPEGIDYTGVDYSREIIAYATEHFGGPARTFVWSTIDRFLDELGDRTLDVIIAFEVLEHVTNGRAIAQRLKQHAKTVLLTTPYREPVGFWGPHHVLHGLAERDFPQFAYRYMHITGAIESYPTVEIANLLLMEWRQGETYPDRQRVLCAIPTRGRYDCLMQCLQAVAFQTVKPDKVIVYDDAEGARQDLREHPIGRYLLPLLNRHQIEWEVVFTPGKGQHIAHQLANQSGYDYVWRLDDDNVPEPDVLERLLSRMQDDVGAVGGAVYELQRIVRGGTGKIQDFFSRGNVQWEPDHGVFDVDHLYGSFLYRPGIVDYKHAMSPAAFQEETIFTHRLKRAGYRLIADTSIHTHHFKAPHGGTRATDLEWGYAWDQVEFLKVMEQEWGIKLIHLGVGLGDCFAFKHILPDLQRKYRHVILGSCYPEVFQDDRVTLIPYEAAKANSTDNVYDWMAERNWSGHIIEAFRAMYLEAA
jgi:SAM-dependent methyltransferase